MVQNINCYFDDQEYFYTDNKVVFSHFMANESDPNWKYYSDYQKRYLILLKMFQDLKASKFKNIYVYHDSRLVEEMKGVLPALNSWGDSIKRYVSRNVIPYFIDIYFIKKSLSVVKKAINDGKEIFDNKLLKKVPRKISIAKGV